MAAIVRTDPPVMLMGMSQRVLACAPGMQRILPTTITQVSWHGSSPPREHRCGHTLGGPRGMQEGRV